MKSNDKLVVATFVMIIVTILFMVAIQSEISPEVMEDNWQSMSEREVE